MTQFSQVLDVRGRLFYYFDPVIVSLGFHISSTKTKLKSGAYQSCNVLTRKYEANLKMKPDYISAKTASTCIQSIRIFYTPI